MSEASNTGDDEVTAELPVPAVSVGARVAARRRAVPRHERDEADAVRAGKIADALIVIMRHGHRRGPQRAWVLDQVVRELTGDYYQQWVANFEMSDRQWDTGTKPL